MKNTIILLLLITLGMFSCKNGSKKEETISHELNRPVEKQMVTDTTIATVITLKEEPLQTSISTQARNIDWQDSLEKIAQDIWQAYASSSDLPFEVKVIKHGDFPMKIATYIADTLGRGSLIEFNKNTLIFLEEAFPISWKTRVASIMGHEIWHHVEKFKYSMSFANSTHNIDRLLPRIEDAADVNGNFLAYLAGYDTRDLFAETIELLYKKCQITEDGNDKYFPLCERKKTANRAMIKLNALVHLFNSGIYCSLLGEYDMARSCYQAIINEGYEGREIYYNQGINYLLEVLNGQLKEDAYIWPLTLEDGSRLKVQSENGALGSDKRASLIHAATIQFKEALKISPSYHQASLHLLIAYALKGDRKAMLGYYKESISLRNTHDIEFHEKALLITILYDLQFGDDDMKAGAFKELQALKSSKSERVKQLVEWNSNIYEKENLNIILFGKTNFDKTYPPLSGSVPWRSGISFDPIRIYWHPVHKNNMWVKLEQRDISIIISSEEVNYEQAVSTVKNQPLPLVSMINDQIYPLDRNKSLLVIQKKKKKAYLIEIKK